MYVWCVYVCVCECVYDCVCVCMYMYVCVCMCVYICVCMCMYVCVCVCIYMCVYVCVCGCLCMTVCVCVCVCMQLKMQHAQALQTMNAELVGLQQELLRELAQLPAPLLPPAAEGSPDLSPPLLSLLAEFIDCSLMAIQQSIGMDAAGQQDRSALRKVVYASLSWTDIVLADGTDMLTCLSYRLLDRLLGWVGLGWVG